MTERVLAEQRVSRLYAVAAALSEAVTPEDVARVTVHQGIAAVGATAGSLALLSEDGANLEMAGSVGYPAEVIGRWKRFPLDAPIPLAEAALRGEPVYTESPEDRLARYPALAPVNALKATQASACLPLKSGGRTIGTLGLSFERPGRFSADEREFMLSLARQCAQALERARLFEAERQARAEAERASQMKDEFLATLSHELRTPLNAILGWSQILAGRREKNEEDLAEGLRTIERNARAQTQIIEDLLDMSRIISGKVRLDVQRVDLAAVVQAAVETVKPAADAKGVRLQVVLDPLAGPVSGDPNRLQQVFWNLLTNAVKFTPRGGRVQVLLERVNSHLEVSVIDTGEGIDSGVPALRVRPLPAGRRARPPAGTAGWASAWPSSSNWSNCMAGASGRKSPGVGHGATFTVSLPVTAVHAEPEPSPERRHPSARNGPVDARRLRAGSDGHEGSGGGRRAGREGAGEATARRLQGGRDRRSVGGRSTGTDRGRAAGRARQRHRHARRGRLRVDPAGCGRLGRNEAGPSAVALTAYARAEDRMKAMMAGFQHHVAKPVEPAELITMVASLATRMEKGSR